ncbi:MAG: hypothetical protein Q9212_003436 [Teloschistes hypoglaucus]
MHRPIPHFPGNPLPRSQESQKTTASMPGVETSNEMMRGERLGLRVLPEASYGSVDSLTTTTPTTSPFAPSQTIPSSGITPSTLTPTASSTILPFPTTSSLAPSRTDPPSGMKSSSLTSIASSTTLPPPSPSPGADGVHLVGFKNGTILGSGFAYYRSAQQGNQGAMPDDFTIANVHINGQWEGFNTTGYLADTGITIWADINQTTSAVNGLAGTASDGRHLFLCYKDNTGFLYKENEIYFYSLYYCQ